MLEWDLVAVLQALKVLFEETGPIAAFLILVNFVPLDYLANLHNFVQLELGNHETPLQGLLEDGIQAHRFFIFDEAIEWRNR